MSATQAARRPVEIDPLWALVSSVVQSIVPTPSVLTNWISQVLSGGTGFGTGSGAPKRQPTSVQLRRLPVSATDVAPSVSVVPLHPVTL